MKDAKFIVFLCVQLLAGLALFGVIVFWPGQWGWMRWTGLVIGAPAMILLFVARFQLGKSFSATPQARELVTRGLYSRIRNPMYVFSGLLVAGFVLALQRPVFLFVLAVLVPAQILRARQEAKVLEAKFGDAYREYRKNTWF